MTPARRPPAGRGSARGSSRTGKPQPARAPRKTAPPAAVEVLTESLRLGFVAGATPGKWISIWRDRYPQAELELVPLDAGHARDAVLGGDVDVAILREPVERDDLHVIALYDEVVGIVVAKDSVLESVAEVTAEDLDGEVLIVPRDDVVCPDGLPGVVPATFTPPQTTADAIEIVASGVGFVVVPMSVARLHQRKDVVFRPLVNAEPAPVALAWRRDNESPAIQAFIGVVRGRTAQSSRD